MTSIKEYFFLKWNGRRIRIIKIRKEIFERCKFLKLKGDFSVTDIDTYYLYLMFIPEQYSNVSFQDLALFLPMIYIYLLKS